MALARRRRLNPAGTTSTPPSTTGVFVLGLTAGLGLILHYFFVTPFEICSASFGTMTLTEVWPWALPLLATEGFALALSALGLCLISHAREEHEVGHAHP